MTISNKIKWAIVGCGNIANKFASDLKLIDDAELYAVASRSIERAQKFAIKHNVRVTYESYSQLFLDNNIDIVYIATPHISHAELSIKAMKCNKHVLCEKPLALNKKETIEILKTSQRTNRFFMEGLWTRFNPSLIAIKKHIDNDEIGRLTYINADFSFLSTHSIDSRVFDLKLGGGALLDIGIYPAFLAYLFMGIPKEIIAASIFHKVTKCDIETSIIFNYKNAHANLYCSFTSNSNKEALIRGTKGDIYIHSRWHVPTSYTLVKNNKKETFNVPTLGIGFTHEIIECQKSIRANKIESENWSHQNSLDLITLLDEVRAQIGLKYSQE